MIGNTSTVVGLIGRRQGVLMELDKASSSGISAENVRAPWPMAKLFWLREGIFDALSRGFA